MSTAKKFQSVEYFEELPESTQELIRDLILDAAKKRGGPDCWKSDDDCVESIECHSRDGFIPYSHNRGGLTYRNFTDLMAYWGGGYTCAHAGAAKEIERQIDYSLKLAKEGFWEQCGDECQELGLSLETVDYHTLQELKAFELAERLSEFENANLSDESSSIMHEFRIMYHGMEDGMHSASVSAAVNTEGPYHRSSISWAPGVFCEGAKEVEITWKTEKELKRKLTEALATVSKEVF